MNGEIKEKVSLNEEDRINFTCLGVRENVSKIHFHEIGQTRTFEEQERKGTLPLPANVSLNYEPLDCNKTKGNCSKVVEMTVTSEMDKKAYQCLIYIDGSPDVYSRGVYITGNIATVHIFMTALTNLHSLCSYQKLNDISNICHSKYVYVALMIKSTSFKFDDFAVSSSPSLTRGQPTNTQNDSYHPIAGKTVVPQGLHIKLLLLITLLSMFFCLIVYDNI